MVSFKSLLNEIYGGPKAIIVTGASGVGKSTLITNVIKTNVPSNFIEFNPDTYNPKDDPKAPKVLANAKAIKEKGIPQAIANKQSFIYDTTGYKFDVTANLVQQLQQSGYQVMMVMLYASPIVTFLRNFNRERKIQKAVVLENWAKVYRLIDAYNKIPNLEFVLVQSSIKPEEKKATIRFQQALDQNELSEYFKELMGSDPDKFRSSFSKPTIDGAEDLPDSKEVKKKEQAKKALEDRWDAVMKDLKDQFKEVEKYLKIVKPMDFESVAGAVKTFAKP